MNLLKISQNFSVKLKYFSRSIFTNNFQIKNFLKNSPKRSIWITTSAGVFGTAIIAGYALYESKSSGSPLISISQTEENEGKKISDKITSGIPTEIPYLIIGSGIAGMSAARAIRASDPLSKILIVNSEPNNGGVYNENYLPYRRTLLTKYIWRRSDSHLMEFLDSTGDVKQSSYLFIEPESFFIEPQKINESEYGGISLLSGHRVVQIDPSDCSVRLEYRNHRIKYRACLIATGALPNRLRSLEIADNTGTDLWKSGKLSYFRGLNDFRNLNECIKSLKNSIINANEDKKGNEVACAQKRRVMIIGGGVMGTELTATLSRLSRDQQGRSVEVVEVMKERSHLWDILPERLSQYVFERVSEMPLVKVLPQSEVISLSEITEGTDAGRLSASIRSTGSDSNTTEIIDHVIVAAGTVPETTLSKFSNLSVDKDLKGFLANEEFEASKGLFVAGESCSFIDKLLGKRRVKYWNTAEETGLIAGHNMAAYVLKSIGEQPHFVDYSVNAFDVLKPRTYNYQTSFSFNLNVYNSIEAFGLVDSNLETRTFIATDFFDEDLSLDIPEPKPSDIPENRKDHDPLDMPGVVFYLKDKKIVGVLMWNCDDDMIIDTEFPSPLRSNIARKILSEQKTIETESDLVDLAADFDLSFFVNNQMKFLEEFSKKKKDESVSEPDVQLT